MTSQEQTAQRYLKTSVRRKRKMLGWPAIVFARAGLGCYRVHLDGELACLVPEPFEGPVAGDGRAATVLLRPAFYEKIRNSDGLTFTALLRARGLPVLVNGVYDDIGGLRQPSGLGDTRQATYAAADGVLYLGRGSALWTYWSSYTLSPTSLTLGGRPTETDFALARRTHAPVLTYSGGGGYSCPECNFTVAPDLKAGFTGDGVFGAGEWTLKLPPRAQAGLRIPSLAQGKILGGAVLHHLLVYRDLRGDTLEVYRAVSAPQSDPGDGDVFFVLSTGISLVALMAYDVGRDFPPGTRIFLAYLPLSVLTYGVVATESLLLLSVLSGVPLWALIGGAGGIPLLVSPGSSRTFLTWNLFLQSLLCLADLPFDVVGYVNASALTVVLLTGAVARTDKEKSPWAMATLGALSLGAWLLVFRPACESYVDAPCFAYTLVLVAALVAFLQVIVTSAFVEGALRKK